MLSDAKDFRGTPVFGSTRKTLRLELFRNITNKSTSYGQERQTSTFLKHNNCDKEKAAEELVVFSLY